jgi:hypothetical protein
LKGAGASIALDRVDMTCDSALKSGKKADKEEIETFLSDRTAEFFIVFGYGSLVTAKSGLRSALLGVQHGL